MKTDFASFFNLATGYVIVDDDEPKPERRETFAEEQGRLRRQYPEADQFKAPRRRQGPLTEAQAKERYRRSWLYVAQDGWCAVPNCREPISVAGLVIVSQRIDGPIPYRLTRAVCKRCGAQIKGEKKNIPSNPN